MGLDWIDFRFCALCKSGLSIGDGFVDGLHRMEGWKMETDLYIYYILWLALH